MLVLGACDSNRSQGDRQQQSQTNSKESELSDCYDKITHLCQKMEEEGESFFRHICNIEVRNEEGDLYDLGQYYPTAAFALTHAVNGGSKITYVLPALKQGESIISNLQTIDNTCYDIENECSAGIEELKDNKKYITSSQKDSWISVLERINNYSSEIREQVQSIRDLQ